MSEVWGDNPTHHAQRLANGVWQVGSVLAPLAVGAVFASTGSFPAVFATLAVGPLLAVVVLACARRVGS